METGPSALIEAIVGRLVPPASREHVLGDLRERTATTREYVAEAIRVVPLVMYSRMRRTFDGLLILHASTRRMADRLQQDINDLHSGE